MIMVLICFLWMIWGLTEYIFQKVFVRGEIYDITQISLGKNSKLKKYVKDFEKNQMKIKKYPMEWIYIRSNEGLLLAGRLFSRDNSDKIVIFFHGYRSIAENDFATYFEWYYEQGYSILLVDQRAHGKSEGKYITFGIKESEDCANWCKHIILQYPNIHQIVLAGMSMGATTVLLASALSLPKEVKGIVSDSAFTSPKHIIHKVASGRYGIDISFFWPFLKKMSYYKAHFDLEKGNVLEALPQCDLPIFWIHATSDGFVPSKMTKEHFQRCHSPKKMVLVDCFTHGFAHVYDQEKVHSELVYFLKSLA